MSGSRFGLEVDGDNSVPLVRSGGPALPTSSCLFLRWSVVPISPALLSLPVVPLFPILLWSGASAVACQKGACVGMYSGGVPTGPATDSVRTPVQESIVHNHDIAPSAVTGID